MRSIIIINFLMFIAGPLQAQDNWISIQQGVAVKEYAGKNFRYSIAVKTNGSAEVLALTSAQVTRVGGEWGYFNNGMDQAVWDTGWVARTTEGKLDPDAAVLNLGIVCMGNGSCYYDDARLEIEVQPGEWKNISLNNGGFELASGNQLPQGWQMGKPSPNFTIGSLQEGVYEKRRSLAITGAGMDAGAEVSFIRRIAFAHANYVKREYSIPMRDGTKLFTAVYTPKKASATNQFPIMLHRTPYGIGPYGEQAYPFNLAPGRAMAEEGYIFVHQDVRGRYKSEGKWTNLTPHIADKRSANEVDESTDTWDTIDWLLKNVSFNNGRVGQWGISYPGFFASAGSINAHPALKAVSPQAPVADFFFDDFHHNGAFTQAYFPFFPVVGVDRKEPTTENWFPELQHNTGDSYEFFKRFTTVKEAADSLLKNNVLWKEMVAHPDYDTFWKKRRITDHLKDLKPAYLITGGWFDAEDLYGTLTTYKTIEQNNRGIFNSIVMGPFGHGDWARDEPHTVQHQLYYGDSISGFYQRNIEAKFFRHYLKGSSATAVDLPEAYMFDTGIKEWKTFTAWPPVAAKKQKLYLQSTGRIGMKNEASTGFSSYISDPAKPVPYTMDVPGSFGITPRNYMNEDQRFAGSRPDVLVYETAILEEDLTLGGEITVRLNVSSTGTDADWIVKLIDVYPGDEPNTPYTPKGISLGGYQQLVRGDVMRSRWRNSFERPEPLVPGKQTIIRFLLQDVLHTFKKGHKLMIQVQSTWFPLIDRNPQTFVPNIYEAKPGDFIKATQRVYSGGANGSYVEVDVLKF